MTLHFPQLTELNHYLVFLNFRRNANTVKTSEIQHTQWRSLMNILKKIYCRIFQTCFRIALPVLPYREPELIDGFKHVPEVLKNITFPISCSSPIRGLQTRTYKTFGKTAFKI